MSTDRYFLKVGRDPWREVDENEFISAERLAGFTPPSGYDHAQRATDGFYGGGVRGRAIPKSQASDPLAFHWDPDFQYVLQEGGPT
jgi:hypothetical protein